MRKKIALAIAAIALLAGAAAPAASAHPGGDPADHRTLVDASQTVSPRLLTTYIANNAQEFNQEPWHLIWSGALAGEGCHQHIGNTTWATCTDGRVFSS